MKIAAWSRGETKWSGVPLAMPTRGIRMPGPRGMAATGGVWSPPRHHAWFHVL
jgi:hypothetical protein